MRLVGALLRRGGLLVTVFLAMSPAIAHADLSWSSPVFLNDLNQVGMSGVACPSVSQCTAVDYRGMEATYNPAAPKGWSAYAIDSTALNSVACPSVGECVAVDSRGREISFDPQMPGTISSDAIDPGASLEAISCPAVSQCTASDSRGRVVSFDPASPGRAVATSFSSTELSGISCPTRTQCTVIDTGNLSTGVPVGSSRLITFDPASSGAGRTTVTDPWLLGAISCPTATECVATVSEGSTVTFDPTSSQTPLTTTRNQNNFLSLACPSPDQCTAMDVSGQEATFDPNTSSPASVALVDTVGDYPKGFNRGEIACPSLSLCSVVSSTLGSDEMSFNPLAPRTPTPIPIDDGAPGRAVSCPTSTECVTLASATDLYAPGPIGAIVPLDPRSGSSRSARWIFVGTPVDLSCPTSTQCTSISRIGSSCSCVSSPGGGAVTFNPLRRPATFSNQGRRIDRAWLTGISCPTAGECIAADVHGFAIAFTPRHLRSRHQLRLTRKSLTGISCPSASECVAVDRTGHAITFSPAALRVLHRSRLDSHRLTALTCPSARQCTATDKRGYQITFNPQTDRRLSRHRIDRHALVALSCTSVTLCAAIGTSREVLTGNPRSRRLWNPHSLAGASALTDIACRPSGGCVVVDAGGHAYTHRP